LGLGHPDQNAKCNMLLIETAAAVFVGLVALIMMFLANRPANDLGTVSHRWIAEHRVDSR